MSTSVQQAIPAAIRWGLRIGHKFLRGAPLPSLLIVLTTLVSQLAVLLASLLPLKVILLLGSPQVPEYFPAGLQALGRSNLIIALSGLAVLFFLLHRLSEQLTARAAARGARRLLARASKLALFDNQEEIASRSYQRYARGAAGLIFTLVGTLALVLVYPVIALFFCLYSLLAAGVLALLCQWQLRIRQRWLDAPVPLVELAGALGFLGGFAGMVADHLNNGSRSVLLTVLALLLLRQLFRHLSLSLADLAVLYGRRRKLDALFFREQVFHGRLAEDGRQNVWALLQPAVRNDWMRQVLHEVAGLQEVQLDARWQQSGIADVVLLQVSAWRADEMHPCGQYLLRLFNSNRSALARHEAGLLAEGVEGLPAPAFIGTLPVQGFPCHVLELPEGLVPGPRELKGCAARLRTELLAVTPPAALAIRYARSRPLLWQRLDEPLLDHLRLALDDVQDLRRLELLELHLDDFRQRLRDLPLVIINPDLQADNLRITPAGSVLCCHWGRWGLEPLGAEWPEQDDLMKAMAQAAQSRPALAAASLDDVRLCMRLAAFEKACQRQQYREAASLLAGLPLH